MSETLANICARSTEKLSFKSLLLDLQLSYDRALILPRMWPGLSPIRLSDPDILWKKNPDLALSVAEKNADLFRHLADVQRRRASAVDDYRISEHALALRGFAAEQMIAAVARRHTPFAVSVEPPLQAHG